jgi:Tfp pilus assembly protein PilZ
MNSSDSTMRQLVEALESMSENERVLLLEELVERKNTSKRKHPRRTFANTVQYSDGQHFFEDVASNLSESGVIIATRKSFAVGQNLSVVIPFGNLGASFKFDGEVVWASDEGIGIKFLGGNRYFSEIMQRNL